MNIFHTKLDPPPWSERPVSAALLRELQCAEASAWCQLVREPDQVSDLVALLDLMGSQNLPRDRVI